MTQWLKIISFLSDKELILLFKEGPSCLLKTQINHQNLRFFDLIPIWLKIVKFPYLMFMNHLIIFMMEIFWSLRIYRFRLDE
jgi:hypothetical protein